MAGKVLRATAVQNASPPCLITSVKALSGVAESTFSPHYISQTNCDLSEHAAASDNYSVEKPTNPKIMSGLVQNM